MTNLISRGNLFVPAINSTARTALHSRPALQPSQEIEKIKRHAVSSFENFQLWLELEKFTNGISPRSNNPLATFTQVEPHFRPNFQESFSLPLFVVPRADCQIVQAKSIDPRITKAYVGSDRVLFAVHPQIAKSNEILNIEAISAFDSINCEVSSTASSRTVAVMNERLPKHCLKTHFPLQITRSIRHLEKRKILHSVLISDDLSKLTAHKKASFGFLPESLGVIYGKGEDAWGYLVREMTPKPYNGRDKALMPLFSLYSPDVRKPQSKFILERLIENEAKDPESYILERILYPILKNWVDVFLETGILLEAHGQNTCFEVDRFGKLGRPIFRDFDTYVNRDIRHAKGLSVDGLNPFELFDTKGSENSPQGSHFSLIFDQAMKVPFDRIAELAENQYSIPKTVLQSKCRSYLRQIFPEGDTFFPIDNKIYNYSTGALAVGSKAQLVITPDVPVWR